MAIQKLDKFDSTEASIYHVEKLYAKVSQLVDAVNNQQIQLNNHECRLLDLQNQINEHDQEIDDCAATVSKMENVQDKYAEQKD